MKTYEVEFKRTSFVTYSVEADSEEEAQEKAWEELESDNDWSGYDADWEIQMVESKP